MTPKTDTETRYAARSGAGVGSAPATESAPATRRESERARVAWSHVLPLAVVLAFANGFWIIVLRGAVGAIERTSAPFSTWLHESTLLVPVYVVAVLVAFRFAHRWFGARPRGIRAVSGSIGLVAAATTAAGTLLLITSAWFDFQLQKDDLHHTGQMHMSCDSVCVSDRIRATLNMEIKGAWVGLLLMLGTSLIMTALVVAFRGGVIVLARSPRDVAPRTVEGTRLVLAAGLLGAGVIHAAVVPEHFDEWWAAGTFFVALVLAEVGTAVAVLARSRAVRTPALVAAAVVSAGPLLVWAVSRTSGLPFGPEAFEPEAIGVADVLSCALELTTLVIAVVLLRRRSPGGTWTPYGLAIGLCAVLAATLIGVGGADLPGVGAFSSVGQHHATHGVISEG